MTPRTKKESINAQPFLHATTLVHMLTVTINAVLPNHAVLGERRVTYFSKDASGPNIVELLPNMRETQLLTNAQMVKKFSQKPQYLLIQYQLVQVVDQPQLILPLTHWVELHSLNSLDTQILMS